MSTRSRETFHQLVTLPDGAIPLAEAALLMACEEYPQLTISPYLDQLDSIAARVESRLQHDDTPLQIIEKINSVLYGELGFTETLKTITTRATASSMTFWSAAPEYRFHYPRCTWKWRAVSRSRSRESECRATFW
jgi:hypothetical protein